MHTAVRVHLSIYSTVVAMALTGVSFAAAQIFDEPLLSPQTAEPSLPGVVADTMTAPAAPTGLNAVAGDRQVTLFWSDPDDSAVVSYEYNQKTGSGNL